jgi:hypothetical protein
VGGFVSNAQKFSIARHCDQLEYRILPIVECGEDGGVMAFQQYRRGARDQSSSSNS